MKKSKKYLTFSVFGFGLIFATSVLSACSTTQKSNVTRDKVIFETAQSKVYPLMIAMRPLVNLYNEQQKNEPNFVPVELRTADQNQINSESKLATTVVSQIETNDKNLPNLILNNKSGAYLVNRYRRLLSLNGTKISTDIFPDKLMQNYNKLAGQPINDKTIYNIPFDITDVDSIAFNLVNMAKIFSIIKDNGGTIDENLVVDGDYKLYQEAKKVESKMSQIPETSIFHSIKAKNSSENKKDAFKDVKITSENFATTKALMEFAKMVNEKTTIERNDKVHDGRIFSIDYAQSFMAKDIFNELNGSFLWSLKANSNGRQGSFIDYNVAKPNDPSANTYKKLWDQYSQFYAPQSATDEKVSFHSTQFMSNNPATSTGVWAAWDLRAYDVAFGIAAAVGVEQAMASPTAFGFFGNKAKPTMPTAETFEEFEKRSAKYDEIYYGSQLLRSNSENNNQTYLDGGSSLVAIDVKNEKLNKGTQKFLSWLYAGNVKVKNDDQNGDREISAARYLIENSGYIVPLKTLVTNQQLSNLQKQYDELTKSIDSIKGKSEKTAADKAKHNQLFTRRNYLRSAIVSLKSLLNFLNPSANVNLLSAPSDSKTSEAAARIKNDLYSSTANKIQKRISSTEALGNIVKILEGTN